MHALITSLRLLTAISYQIALKIASVFSLFLRLYDYQESNAEMIPAETFLISGVQLLIV
jgi:hypothetical protein